MSSLFRSVPLCSPGAASFEVASGTLRSGVPLDSLPPCSIRMLASLWRIVDPVSVLPASEVSRRQGVRTVQDGRHFRAAPLVELLESVMQCADVRARPLQLVVRTLLIHAAVVAAMARFSSAI
jgi:hypothetical protein